VKRTNAVIAMKRHTTRGLAKQTKLQTGTMLLLVMPVAEVVQVVVVEVPVVEVVRREDEEKRKNDISGDGDEGQGEDCL
jgi:hypothetical protein